MTQNTKDQLQVFSPEDLAREAFLAFCLEMSKQIEFSADGTLESWDNLSPINKQAWKIAASVVAKLVSQSLLDVLTEDVLGQIHHNEAYFDSMNDTPVHDKLVVTINRIKSLTKK